ncbi:Short-chain dehydrogenase/reductase SDR [Pleurostoma richardsiae]|uniref:Short-chain dehydrogenase/reductase SDR n=1 Tax=Pleurostoma richardsiae TaxID=41990 RepID=A0AA38VXR4_9PEZI|nr:Short-chain dehydrogenase/reductase SDR [Pleurostoma richardsiae]
MLYNGSPDTLFLPAAGVDPTGYGKVAIVTGCSSGIGLACTQLLLAHQFQVCGLDASDFNYELLREADHGRFHFHKEDLTAPGACDQGVRVCVATFGERIDVLVNVAGVMDNFSSADAVTDEVWDAVMTTNLTVPVKMMRAVIRFMKAKNDGVIINIASTAGLSGALAGIAYTASKHGLLGATKNVAWRFRNEGIRCNAILPGAIDSAIGKTILEGQKETWDAEAYAQVEPVHTLQVKSSNPRRRITPLEVAKTVAFLVSDEARTINGVSLPVDQAWNVV